MACMLDEGTPSSLITLWGGVAFRLPVGQKVELQDVASMLATSASRTLSGQNSSKFHHDLTHAI